MGSFSKGQTIFIVIFIVLLTGLDVFLYIFFKNKTEDLWKLSDINQIRSALEINYAINTQYPLQVEPLLLNTRDRGSEKLCLQNFTSLIQSCEKTLIGRVPNSIGPVSNPYIYLAQRPKEDYSIEFNLNYNNQSFGLSKGPNCASRGGIRSGSCL